MRIHSSAYGRPRPFRETTRPPAQCQYERLEAKYTLVRTGRPRPFRETTRPSGSMPIRADRGKIHSSAYGRPRPFRETTRPSGSTPIRAVRCKYTLVRTVDHDRFAKRPRPPAQRPLRAPRYKYTISAYGRRLPVGCRPSSVTRRLLAGWPQPPARPLKAGGSPATRVPARGATSRRLRRQR